MDDTTQKIVDIDSTEDSPRIFLNANEHIFRIYGPSYSADAFATYYQVVQWVQVWGAVFTDKLNCEFDFTILSSASHKMVFEILVRLENLFNSGKDISVNWYYAKFDEDMLEIGESFSETINLPFRFIAKDRKSFFNQ